MSDLQIWVLSGLLFYLLIMLVMGFLASRNQTHDGYIIGSRNVGYIPTIGSLSAGFRDGTGAVFWFGFGATAAYAGMWLIFGAILGLMFYSFVGPVVRERAKAKNYITIGELVREELGRYTEKSSSLIVLFVAFIYIAIQLYVSGNIFAFVLGMPSVMGVGLIALVVGIYMYFGGYNTVVKTDAVQFVLILSLIISPFILPPAREEIMQFDTLFAMGGKNMIALFLIGLIMPLSLADVWQRVFSARDAKVIRYSFPAAGLFLIVMTLSLVFLGMGAKPLLGEEISNSDALFHLFNVESLPPAFLTFVAIVVLAISMSTLDTGCYLCASTLTKNYLPARWSDTREKYVSLTRRIILGILLAMSFVALMIEDVVQFLLSFFSILYILAPVYILTALGLFRDDAFLDRVTTLIVALSVAVFAFLMSTGRLEDLMLTLVPGAICAFGLGVLLIADRLIRQRGVRS